MQFGCRDSSKKLPAYVCIASRIEQKQIAKSSYLAEVTLESKVLKAIRIFVILANENPLMAAIVHHC